MKELGHIKTLSIDLEQPKMKIEKIEFNKLSLLTGANDTRKTFILVLNWVSSLIAAIYISVKNKNMLVPLAQFVLNKSFDDQNFTGSFTSEFEGMKLTCKLEDGKVTDVDIVCDEELDKAPAPIFMSKQTRTYSDIVKYLKTKDLLGLKGVINPMMGDNLDKLSELYKLYDILFIEHMISKMISAPLILNQSVRDALKGMGFEKGVKSLHFDQDKIDILYTDDEDVTQSTTTLSAGEQSLLNIVTANA